MPAAPPHTHTPPLTQKHEKNAEENDAKEQIAVCDAVCGLRSQRAVVAVQCGDAEMLGWQLVSCLAPCPTSGAIGSAPTKPACVQEYQRTSCRKSVATTKAWMAIWNVRIISMGNERCCRMSMRRKLARSRSRKRGPYLRCGERVQSNTESLACLTS